MLFPDMYHYVQAQVVQARLDAPLFLTQVGDEHDAEEPLPRIYKDWPQCTAAKALAEASGLQQGRLHNAEKASECVHPPGRCPFWRGPRHGGRQLLDA